MSAVQGDFVVVEDKRIVGLLSVSESAALPECSRGEADQARAAFLHPEMALLRVF